MTKIRRSRDLVIERLEIADRSFRRACARAVADGVPLRAVADYAEVSHVTVRKWVASVPAEELERFAGVDGARVPPLPGRSKPKPVSGRPGTRGLHGKRRKGKR